MKKIILLSFALFAITTVSTAQVKAIKDGAKIQFEKETIDYGTIENNADGNRIFKFTNSGNVPLVITNAKGSCGCTVPTWPKGAIAPGESSTIKVHYDTSRKGAFSKSITLTSNDVNEPSKVIQIKGTVKGVPAAGKK